MRVLLIAPQPFFTQRGTPINVRAMATCLGSGGYDVDLLVFPLGDDVSLAGVRVLRSLALPGIRHVPPGPSWKKFALDIFLFLQALYLVLTQRYRVLHGVEEGGFIAALLGRLTGTPYVFDMDSSMPEQLEYSGFFRSKLILGMLSGLESWGVKNAAAVLTVCEDLSLTARGISESVPVVQIEDFPLDSATEVPKELLDRIREEYFPVGTQTVLYTGNFESYQGIDLLFASFAALKKKDVGANVRLLLVGGGDPQSDLFLKYQQQAKALGLRDSVLFAGQRPMEEMGAFMALSDVLVSPRTLGGNTPLKVYTYMAAGVPMAATEIDSHTQVLDQSSAFLAEPTPRAFAEALAAALDRSNEGQRESQQRAMAAKQLVETRYSKKEFERRLLELYSMVLGRERPNASQHSKQAAAL